MNEQTEIWKDVVGHEGNYKVSNLGHVKTFYNSNQLYPGEILKSWTQTGGYSCVTLHKDGKRFSRLVHRLVIAAFLGTSNLDVDHINGNKSDNRLVNLRYVTKRQNANYFALSRPKSSKYCGVSLSSDKKKWVSYIYYNGIRYSIGTFNCETAAHFAYLKKLNSFNSDNLSAAAGI